MYKLQKTKLGSELNRHDNNPNSDNWHTIAEGKQHYDLIEELLTLLNDDAIVTEDCFFRIVTPENKVINF